MKYNEATHHIGDALFIDIHYSSRARIKMRIAAVKMNIRFPFSDKVHFTSSSDLSAMHFKLSRSSDTLYCLSACKWTWFMRKKWVNLNSSILTWITGWEKPWKLFQFTLEKWQRCSHFPETTEGWMEAHVASRVANKQIEYLEQHLDDKYLQIYGGRQP